MLLLHQTTGNMMQAISARPNRNLVNYNYGEHVHQNSVLPARARPVLRSASADVDTAGTVTYAFDASSYSSNGTSTSTPSSSSSPSSSSAISSITATKLALFEQVAVLNRGTLASRADRHTIERLVQSLEQAGSPTEPFSGSPAPIEGAWELMYTNKEVFRASPFFLAFEAGLVQNKELAETIFAFTDAIPGAAIGRATQTISLLSGSLISEVDLTVFPGLTGTVVTSSRVAVASPSTLALTIEATRVTGSTFSPFLDAVAVPVEQMISAVRGEGAAAALYDITFIDASLRVTRTGDQLMLHRRVL